MPDYFRPPNQRRQKNHPIQPHRSRPVVPPLIWMRRVGWAAMLAAWVSMGQAQPLTWVHSQSQALELAQNQGKLILLLAGRDSCAECDYMHNTVCESTDPPVKALIQDAYVPWYCDIDFSDEWKPYAAGMSSFPLPLICTIHPTNATGYLDRSVNLQLPNTFYSRLLSIAGIQLTNAHIHSLSVGNGVARINLSQLTFGATHSLERSLDLRQPEGWIPVTNFVSLSRTNSLTDTLDPQWKQVFYRITSSP